MPLSHTGKNIIRFGLLALVVAAIISGYPQKLFRSVTPLKAAADRPRLPEFTLPAVGGGQFRTADHQGKVMLVNFWATWCPPCRQETPELVSVYSKYSGRGLAMVGISMDDDPAQVVPGFIRQYRMNYPVAVPTEDFALARNVESLPTTLLIDRNGRVAKSYIGAVDASDVEGDIERLLAE